MAEGRKHCSLSTGRLGHQLGQFSEDGHLPPPDMSRDLSFPDLEVWYLEDRSAIP